MFRRFRRPEKRVTDHGFCVGKFFDIKRQRATEYVVIPDGKGGVVLNGPPGTGKTSLAIFNCVHLQRPIVADDSKGTLGAILGRLMMTKRHGGFRAVNPYQLHAATHQHMRDIGWNACADIARGSLDFAEDCQNLIIACNERHGSSDANSYFDNSATELGTAVLQGICCDDPDATMVDFRNAIADQTGIDPRTKEPFGFFALLMHLAEHPDPAIRNKAARFVTNAKSTPEVFASLVQMMGFADFPALQRSMQGPGIDWTALKNSAEMLAFITPADKRIPLKPYMRQFWQTACRELIRAPSTGQFPPVMLLMDEFPQLGRIQSMLTTVAIGREFSVLPVIICQDFSQLAATYGDKDWQTFVTTASCICSFAPNSMYTAQYLSNLCGNRLMIYRSASQKQDTAGIDISASYHDRRLFEPYQLMQMPPGRMLVLVQGLPPFFTQVENYWETSFADRLDPNPFFPRKAG